MCAAVLWIIVLFRYLISESFDFQIDGLTFDSKML